MEKKFLTALLALVAALCLCFGLSACGGGKFSISTLEEIPIGASQEVVRSVLGDPSEVNKGDTKWTYYDGDLLSYADKATELEQKQEKALLEGDLEELDKLLQEYESLMQEVASKKFARIEVSFSSEKKVTSVFLDMAYSMEGAQAKQIQSDKIYYKGSADTIEKQYYTDYRTSEDGVRIFTEDTTEEGSFTYATTFTDGSWYHAALNFYTEKGSGWTWGDANGNHTADKPKNVTVNVKSIGKIDKDGVWSGTKNIEGNFAIPEGVTLIAERAFSGCNELTGIGIPASVTSIGESAFSNCTKLASIEIPASVTTIDKSAFHGCSSLERVIWNAENCTKKNSYSSQSDWIFNGCTKLKSVTIGAGVRTVPIDILHEISGLEHITVDSGNVTYRSEGDCLIDIAKNTVILGCKNSTIPDSVTKIDDSAFYGCSGLTSITIPDGVTEIGVEAFRDCTGLESVEIESGSIGTGAFYECSGLTSISIGEGVTLIAERAFSGCSRLESITVAAENQKYSSQDGILYNKAKTEFQYIPEAVKGSVTIPATMTSIKGYAFANRSGLKSVTIENGVTLIENYAFNGCSGLTSVTIGSRVTEIGSYAFSNCSGLTNIVIPDSVTKIGDRAFFGTAYYGDVNHWDASGVLYIGNHLIEAKDTISGAYTIRENTKTIADSAFWGCRSLENITIPDSVTSIGSYAFYNCPIKKATMPTTAIYSVPNDNLKEVVLTSGETIGDWAFWDWKELESVTIGSGVTSIGWWAFQGCSGLKSVTIGSDVTKISGEAFERCSGLTSITISDSVTSIGVRAFCSCRELTDIQFTGTVEAWQAIEKGVEWDMGADNYTVTCTNGTVDKEGNVTYFNA